MNKSVLISGYGSIGRRHVNILSRLVKKKNITILTNQKLSNFRTIKTLKALNEVDPYYIVICNPTSDHLNKIKFIEKNCKIFVRNFFSFKQIFKIFIFRKANYSVVH